MSVSIKSVVSIFNYFKKMVTEMVNTKSYLLVNDYKVLGAK